MRPAKRQRLTNLPNLPILHSLPHFRLRVQAAVVPAPTVPQQQPRPLRRHGSVYTRRAPDSSMVEVVFARP